MLVFGLAHRLLRARHPQGSRRPRTAGPSRAGQRRRARGLHAGHGPDRRRRAHGARAARGRLARRDGGRRRSGCSSPRACGPCWRATARWRGPMLRCATSCGLARNASLMRVAAMHFLLFGGYLAMLGLLPRALVESGHAAGPGRPRHRGLAHRRRDRELRGPLALRSHRTKAARPRRRRPGRRHRARRHGLRAGCGDDRPCSSSRRSAAGASRRCSSRSPPRSRASAPPASGAALGLLVLVGQTGGFLLPSLAGTVTQSAGLPGAIALLAAVHLLILAPALGMRDTRASRSAPSGALAT